uniref:Zinc finger CCCH-type containing 7B n=1 Tax=Oryzias latipes TaxID=8090 RepID=A0A3P9LYM5_ORYLA
MDPSREKRKEDIMKALAFIQSSLAYPDPEGYQDYLTQLVCNLLEEGNAFFKDGLCDQAAREFTEGLNVSSYAESEEIQIPVALQESLFVNRAAAYHSMGKYDESIADCNMALEVCKESRRALYRKALCLKELGRYREAYDCTSECLLSCPEDKQGKELAQELTVLLGLKTRKPYVSTKASVHNLKKGTPQEPIPPVSLSSFPQPSFPPVCIHPASSELLNSVAAVEDSELMDDDLDRLLDSVSTLHGSSEAAFSFPFRTSTATHTLPPVLPAPTPQLPPAFFSSAISQLNSLDSFTNDEASYSAAALDILDDLGSSSGDASSLLRTPKVLDALDCLDSLDNRLPHRAVVREEAKEPTTELDADERGLDDLLDKLNTQETLFDPDGLSGDVPKFSSKVLEQLDPLDALDPFSASESIGAASAPVQRGSGGLESLSDFGSNGFPEFHLPAPVVTPSPENHFKKKAENFNPLSSTHEFLQACSTCFPREGVGIYTFVHKPDLVHNCKRDVLLCRRKDAFSSEWTRVRRLPPKVSFSGPFVLCKEVLKSGDLGVCKYGENCTFAYNQLEIDVWTEERKGTLDRNLLFGAEDGKLDPVNSIICLLRENKGMFIFLCQECYDNKPRIISRRSSKKSTSCSNLDSPHNFSANKCLVFEVSKLNVNYNKVRPLSPLCHLDLCRPAIRYGCLREDDCLHAHSVIELKTWKIQRCTGISCDEIVKISKEFYEKQEQQSNKNKGNRLSSGGAGRQSNGGGRDAKSLNMRMKFVCALCLRGGLTSEPDKTLKYCKSKARHAWTKDRRVLLVMSSERSKWVQVRPLPHTKNFPFYYDMCAQILEKRKCNYPGNCTFAHSQEEKEMWMYMKNNDLRDMQQVYDMWLALAAQNRQAEDAPSYHPNYEEKCIIMPTDYADQLSGFHCRLCGKHSNSQRQWQQHISSEKHKDRVFSCEGEDEALTWRYRFPGVHFDICPKLDGGCSEGVSCDFAHSAEELQEWIERRDFLRQKLAKAREDMLVLPDELDFGKFNFLLQD